MFVTVFIDGDAINPQGGGGASNAAGVLSLGVGLWGWRVTAPLGLAMAAAVWLTTSSRR